MKKLKFMLLGALGATAFAQNRLPIHLNLFYFNDYSLNHFMTANNKESEITSIQVNAKGDSIKQISRFNTYGYKTYFSEVKKGREQLISETVYNETRMKKENNDLYFTLRKKNSLATDQKTYRNGKLVYHYKNEYNQLGNEVKSIYFNNGREKKRVVSSYLNDSLLVSKSIYKKGVLKSLHQYKRNENNLVYLETFHNHKKELTKEIKRTFNAFNKVEKLETYKKGKLNSYITYQYNQEGGLLSYVKYDKNNKIIRVSNFECSPVGEYSKKVKQYAVCKYDANIDGFLFKTEEQKNEKGLLRKTVYKYRSSDTALVNISVYNNENQKTFHIDYLPEIKDVVNIEKYNNGKLKVSKHYKYVNGLRSELVIKNKKNQTSRFEYAYTNGHLSHFKKYDKKNNLVSEQIIQRAYYN